MKLNQEKYIKLLESKVQNLQFLISTKNKDLLESVSKEINFDIFLEVPKTKEEEEIYKKKYEDLENHIAEKGYNYNPDIMFEECKENLIVSEKELKECFE